MRTSLRTSFLSSFTSLCKSTVRIPSLGGRNVIIVLLIRKLENTISHSIEQERNERWCHCHWICERRRHHHHHRGWHGRLWLRFRGVRPRRRWRNFQGWSRPFSLLNLVFFSLKMAWEWNDSSFWAVKWVVTRKCDVDGSDCLPIYIYTKREKIKTTPHVRTAYIIRFCPLISLCDVFHVFLLVPVCLTQGRSPGLNACSMTSFASRNYIDPCIQQVSDPGGLYSLTNHYSA